MTLVDIAPHQGQQSGREEGHDDVVAPKSAEIKHGWRHGQHDSG